MEEGRERKKGQEEGGREGGVEEGMFCREGKGC